MRTKFSPMISRRIGQVVSAMAWLALVYFPTPVDAQEFRNYYVTDVVGSPVVSTDAYANAKWSEDYRPYGDRIVQTSYASTDGDNERWFTGAVQSDISGLVNMGNRYYDPVVGRFISIDPVATSMNDGRNFNRYWYGNNNPYSYLDPNGSESAFWDLLDMMNNPMTHMMPNTEAIQAGTRQLMYGEPYSRMDSTEQAVSNYTAGNFEASAAATAKVGDYWMNATMMALGQEEIGAARGLALLRESTLLPRMLTLGRNAEEGVDVYIGVRNGRAVYCGISCNLPQRAAQHGSRFNNLSALTSSSVTRGEARAIEQAVIVRNPGFENIRNSISPTHSWYQQAVDWGEAWLKANGY